MNDMTEGLSPLTREHNACLSDLSPTAFALLRPHLTDLLIDTGTRLWEVGRPAKQVYFPSSGFVTVMLPMSDGSAIEVGSIAREGLAAGSFDEDSNAMTTGLVHIGGKFSRIAIAHLLAAAATNDEIAQLVAANRDWVMRQAQQLVACTALHSAEQRFCRWLLSCHQRMETATLPSTQEQIAALLGIRRTTVTLIAQTLHEKGIIDYRRGKITIVDPAKLEAAACECCSKLGERHWPARHLPATVASRPELATASAARDR